MTMATFGERFRDMMPSARGIRNAVLISCRESDENSPRFPARTNEVKQDLANPHPYNLGKRDRVAGAAPPHRRKGARLGPVPPMDRSYPYPPSRWRGSTFHWDMWSLAIRSDFFSSRSAALMKSSCLIRWRFPRLSA